MVGRTQLLVSCAQIDSFFRNIVNGLRDEDEDYYTRRASFASEYSQTGTNEGGLQVFVKERGHSRSASKGSMSSMISRSKSGKRPETKVWSSF
jgi:serine/arginine repetitive matrix protein 2